jgi:copper(I)-binding protein
MTRFLVPFALLLTACSNDPPTPDLKPSDGWARESVPGQSSAAAYLTVTNNGTGADRLVAVSTDAAQHAMLHSTSEQGGVARMRHMGGGLVIPSKTAVELSPGRTHVMLSGLRKPLRRGQAFTLALKFEKSGE